ncbi:MAG TPA: Asp-tRNA(Asn)/Glu-tRNA(Gln) amidotransferase subunit GatB [Methanomicrobia archaeon]|nr:Asp-tRNA(Asn)/Glu-tRNA(Gln) amidotransferase subunit GatB [Methanomicrobia archaeon]HEX59456.1 Asp-tRNA(Asn)/Glu-tRNA(Gln) amidotransferase subunit GatB [Methanomicrobia archaeon]
MEDVKIGLECHAQLLTRSKLFCGCSAAYHDAAPNTHVCPTCLGLPGALPVVNRKAVEYGIKVALALNCEVQRRTLFYRKNYFYPDLPKGFQISQYDFPLATNGYVRIESDGNERIVRIKRVHLEEDPGRLLYKGTIDVAKYSLIDYNRSGVPLVEIVTEPDLRSPREARIFINKIRSILEYLGVFDGSLEGALRVDANISVAGGERIEIKNISSYKGLERALSFEITRQRNLLRRGVEIKQETRHYDEVRGVTISLRTKEYEEDYRYFPEPDLVPVEIPEDWVEALRKELPELPDEKVIRFMQQYEITREHAVALTTDIHIANFYESVVAKLGDARLCATWVADVLKGELNYRSMSMKEALQRLTPEDFVKILRFMKEEKITERGAVEVLREMLDVGGRPEEIITRKGLVRMRDEEIDRVIKEVIAENAPAVEDYKNGKKEALSFLVGQVMKKTRGRIDPKRAYEAIKELIAAGA